MGRLYDKRDLAFNLEFWNKQESQLSADIANKVIPASFLDSTITYPMGCNCLGGPCGKQHFKYVRARDAFKLERQRERMKLLRTGQLLSDLKHAQTVFDSCDHCHYEVKRGKTVAVECDIHTPALKKCKSAVFWAGKRNLDERNARGQIREEGVATAQEALEGLPEPTVSLTDQPVNPLNQWEEMYQRAKADHTWPKEAEFYDVDDTGYKGYLWVLRFEEEMTEAEYLSELERLRKQAREVEDSALQWAGQDGTKQGSKKGNLRTGITRFTRDTRFNATAN